MILSISLRKHNKFQCFLLFDILNICDVIVFFHWKFNKTRMHVLERSMSGLSDGLRLIGYWSQTFELLEIGLFCLNKWSIKEKKSVSVDPFRLIQNCSFFIVILLIKWFSFLYSMIFPESLFSKQGAEKTISYDNI